MSKSSINIQPVKKTSERHNRREMDLDYVRRNLSHLNQAKEFDTINNRLKKIRAKYEETVGQKMQKRATPIREAVFLIKPETTLDDCLLLSQEIEKKWGINSFQIHMHKDEGHYNEENEWNPNLHAHLVMDWTDPETGKSRKLNKQDMSEMQTMAANILGMERGNKSNKKHLNAMEYKSQLQEEKLKKQGKEIRTLKNLKNTQLNAIEILAGNTDEALDLHRDKTFLAWLKKSNLNQKAIEKQQETLRKLKVAYLKLTNTVSEAILDHDPEALKLLHEKMFQRRNNPQSMGEGSQGGPKV